MRLGGRIGGLPGKLNVFIVVWLILPSAVFAAESVMTPGKALPHTSTEQMMKMVFGLMFVLVMIFILAWLFKKYLGVGVASNSALKAIAGLAVGQKERIVLIQVGERQILVGVSPGRINMLHAIEKGEEVHISSQDSRNTFSEKLKNSIAGLEKK